MKKINHPLTVIALLGAVFLLTSCQQQRRSQKCDCPQWSSLSEPASLPLTHP
ncbi:MAG: lipoprotein [Flavobacteriales bacterium]|nr:lipoprotein [Flavobacteriales bacterium]